ncbi:putative glycosyltransferase family 2 protein [Phaeoacremonium minimum UCRPA7]|uniref:Putative glycosyltransferase family 2 protein n=1 Tax=Phaeoacremonium minimum (strain UCR-PA7) TaxID=1286976 RepID=R8BNR1_PHAM7|nr:putative glycosyltransferase family 2 protein [Phaeoacremonium minimum UCRPA7]EOO00987.1 putative glycosyltransferase family 2 protein [Phaeoacremonium minimum UCRPA7]
MTAPMILGAMWAWGAGDNAIASRYGTDYKPVELPEKPSYSPEKDVTLLVPTIDTPDTFPKSMRTWLANNPLQIVIVTTADYFNHVVNLLKDFDDEIKSGKITIAVSAKPGKREQLKTGIPLAKGRILALSDDDTYWGPKFLKYMLACFENPHVGGAGGAQSAHVLPEHQDENVINKWEVASIRILDRRNNGQVSSYAADGGVFILAGRSVLFRTEILHDPEFLHKFTHDYWRGKYLLDSGDDTFITRWLQEKNWKIVIQSRPETEIQTGIATDRKFLGQLIR